jgi:hypothetical protein
MKRSGGRVRDTSHKKKKQKQPKRSLLFAGNYIIKGQQRRISNDRLGLNMVTKAPRSKKRT